MTNGVAVARKELIKFGRQVLAKSVLKRNNSDFSEQVVTVI